ncbi:MAG: hypothetical protein ACXVZT_00575 [Terriglobales bacterium]
MKSQVHSRREIRRLVDAISLLARVGFWVDRLWQQMQRHRLFYDAVPELM